MEKTVIQLNDNWSFYRGEQPNGSEYETVCLPHTVQLTPANSSGCRNYQGMCHYRKKVYIPNEYCGKKLFLTFEGAMGVSRLYINGREISAHYCGYTPFVTDIGEFINYGALNDIYITLDNSDDPTVPPGKPQKDLDFSYDGGLYRKAWLTVCDKLYITDPLLADEVSGGGIFIHYEDVGKESAKTLFRVQIKNEYSEKKNYTFKATVVAQDGTVVGAFSTEKSIAAEASDYVSGEIIIKNPMLWSPEEPNLYRFKAEIVTNGTTSYAEAISIGIRDYKFTINDGVIFNGVSRRFNGANYHQTWPYIGNAVPTNLLIRDLMKLKDAGFDNIRSHYPFCAEFLEACNKMGLTLIVSNPGWQFCQQGLFMERAYQNMRDIIRWQRNNPCILIWEPILNESEMGYDIQKAFHDIVHEEYPFSPCYTASDYGPTDIAYCEYDPVMLGQGMEKFGLIEQKDTSPRPRWIREYGDAPDNFFDQNSIWRSPRGWGDYAMLESVNRMLQRFDNNEKEKGQYINVINDKRLCGYGIWPGISHNRGYHINPCWGGHLDLFRIPKFSYYFLKSQRDISDAGNVLYIASWWTDSSPADVTVYSNAEKIRLYYNDTLIGEQFPDEIPVKHPPFTFKDVKRLYKMRERSCLKAEAIVDGKVVAEEKLTAPGIVTHLGLKADLMDIPLMADGSDIIAVRCAFLDNDENVVPQAGDNHPIVFEVTGEGVLVGDSEIGANPIYAEAGIATILVRSTPYAGEITVKARLLWEQHMPKAVKPAVLNLKSVQL